MLCDSFTVDCYRIVQVNQFLGTTCTSAARMNSNSCNITDCRTEKIRIKMITSEKHKENLLQFSWTWTYFDSEEGGGALIVSWNRIYFELHLYNYVLSHDRKHLSNQRQMFYSNFFCVKKRGGIINQPIAIYFLRKSHPQEHTNNCKFMSKISQEIVQAHN